MISSTINKEDYTILIVEFHPYTEEENTNSSPIKKNKSSTIKNIFFIFICGIYFILNMLVLIHLNNPIIQKGIYIYLIIISLLIIIKNILRLYLLHKFYTDNKKGKTLILSKALPNKIRIFLENEYFLSSDKDYFYVLQSLAHKQIIFYLIILIIVIILFK